MPALRAHMGTLNLQLSIAQLTPMENERREEEEVVETLTILSIN